MTSDRPFPSSSVSGAIREVKSSTLLQRYPSVFGEIMSTGQIDNTIHPQLRGLLSSALDFRAHIAGSNEALYAFLSQAQEVLDLRRALGSGEVLEKEIRDFTNRLLRDFRPNVLFEHDIALAALAVALSRDWNTPFAEEYIIDLAKLRNPEFRRSIAVARLAARRLYQNTDTLSRSFRSVDSFGEMGTWQLVQPSREECSDQLEEFIL